jgi:tetrapyrrole methylase family protein/MazG family protein
MGKSDNRNIQSLIEIICRLRGPEGCMWDRQQTIQTVSPHLIDEAYEVIDAIENGTDDDLKEELGDLLFQILFIITISREDGRFDLTDVIEEISRKMIRRHPHVFGDTSVTSVEEIKANWDMIKHHQEGKERGTDSLLGDVPLSLPSLTLAEKITERASTVGFDWHNVDDVFDKVYEELEELKAALAGKRSEKVGEEIGDILFSLVNLSRFVTVDPEAALRSTVNKFKRRFAFIESQLAEQGKDIRSSTIEEMDELWNHYKKKIHPDG